MKKMIFALLMATSPLFAQVQIGRNVQIGGNGGTGAGCTTDCVVTDPTGSQIISQSVGSSFGIVGTGSTPPVLLLSNEGAGATSIQEAADAVEVSGNASVILESGGINNSVEISPTNVQIEANNSGSSLSLSADSDVNITANLGAVHIAGGGGVTLGVATVPTGSSLAPTGSGTISANQVNGIAVPASQTCLGSNSSSQLITGTCSGGGSSAFNALTSGTNTTAAMVVGSGASLAPTGTGTIAATAIDGVTVTGTPSSGQVITATSGTAATWQTASSAKIYRNSTTYTSFSGSAFAMKGVISTCLASTNLYDISMYVDATAGETYQFLVYTLSGTSTIASIVYTSSVITISTTAEQLLLADLSSAPLALTSGTKYGFVLQITSGTGTTVLKSASAPPNAWPPPPKLTGIPSSVTANFIVEGVVSPTVGSVLTTSSASGIMLNLATSY